MLPNNQLLILMAVLAMVGNMMECIEQVEVHRMGGGLGRGRVMLGYSLV